MAQKKGRPGIGRFVKWLFSTEPADKLLTDEEKEAQGQTAKDEAYKEIEKEMGATPTPSPTPGRK